MRPRPLIGFLRNEVLIARFLKYTTPCEGCWLWTGGSHLNIDGTPRAQFRCGSTKIASRAAYALFKGDVPDDKIVMHSCDNGMCVSPEHLSLGTYRDNTQDMLAKGRGIVGRKRDPATVKRGYRRGWRARVNKLTDDEVRAVRVAAGPARFIADEYDISVNHVFSIKARRRKAHVPD